MKKFIYILTFLALSNGISAMNYYWVSGSGAWSNYANHWATSSGGTVFHVTIPGPGDDVFFDANSFPVSGAVVSLDTTIINCRNMDWSGALNNPTVIGNGYVNIYGSLTLTTNMVWNGWASTRLVFHSTQPGNTITSGGHSFESFAFNGAGGGWSLTDSLSCISLSINQGTFNSNNVNFSSQHFTASNTSTILLGTSVVTSMQSVNFNYPGLILDADSAYFVFPDMWNYNSFDAGNQVFHDMIFYYDGSVGGISATFNNVTFLQYGSINASSATFHKATFMKTAAIDGSNTFDTLFFNNPGYGVSLGANTTQTIIDSVLADGTCSQPITFQSSIPGTRATISKSSGNVVWSNLLMRDIQTTGGASFVANNVVDMGNNSGCVINTIVPRNLYWVNGTGNWNDPNHWALTSGGPAGNCMPAFTDSVFFDSNSFPQASDTVYMNVNPVYCRNMDWSGALNNPTVIGNGYVNIYGSLTLTTNMVWNGWASTRLVFHSTQPGNTITSGGHSFESFAFNGAGGGWSLTDSLSCISLSINQGTFNSNNVNFSSQHFTASNTSTILLGTSVVTSMQSVNFNYPGLILDADSAYFVFPDMWNYNSFDAGNQVFHDMIFYYDGSVGGISATFNNVTFLQYGSINASSATFHKATFMKTAAIDGSNTFDTLFFNNPGYGVSLGANTTQTIIDSVLADGTCSQPITFQSSIPGTRATISKSSGNVVWSNLLMRDIQTTGGASFVANNVVDMGNNSGCVINTIVPRNLYWVNGTGNWNDPNHWALTSGGPAGNCMPAFTDSVFFDSNSFPQASDTVYMNVNPVYCRNMDWSGALNNPTVIGNGYVNIYGSLTLTTNMVWNGWASTRLVFHSTQPGNTITSGGHSFESFAFNGAGGGWSLTDSLSCISLSINQGTFNSNNVNFSSQHFTASNTSTILLGTSVVTSMQSVNFNYPGLILDADSADFVFPGMWNYNSFDASNHSFRNLVFYYSGSVGGESSSFENILFLKDGVISTNSTSIKRAIFLGNAGINGANIIDTLVFINPGKTITLQNASVTTVGSLLLIFGVPGFPINIQCANGTATIFKSSGFICTDYIYLQNITAAGGAQFHSGDHSIDLGGNTGWNWTRCVPLISNVWPGDCNYDLVTDNLDLLNIGVAMGDTGFVRPSASLTYIAQPCQDWYWQFINAVNVKHADCNGNGTVDVSDTTAISLNYGLTHPARPAGSNQSTSTGTDLILQLPTTAVAPGSVISAPIILGTNSNPANNIYGMAFTIDYDSSYIQPASMSIDYTGSWVAGAGNYLHIEKDFPSEGKLDMAFTRYNHTDVSGYGLIGTLNFTVSNTAAGLLAMSFSKVKIISHNEIEIPVVAQSTSLSVDVNEIRNNTPVYLYPNPAREELYLATGPLKGRNAKIIVSDMLGQEMIRMEKSTDQGGRLSAHLQLVDLSSGIYLLRIETEKERLIQKFVKE